jgi:hypothetical protein
VEANAEAIFWRKTVSPSELVRVPSAWSCETTAVHVRRAIPPLESTSSLKIAKEERDLAASLR